MYMFVHDGLVHKRFPVGPLADVPYLKKVAAAHTLHHAERFNGVPWGLFLGPQELEAVGGQKELEHALQRMENQRKPWYLDECIAFAECCIECIFFSLWASFQVLFWLLIWASPLSENVAPFSCIGWPQPFQFVEPFSKHWTCLSHQYCLRAFLLCVDCWNELLISNFSNYRPNWDFQQVGQWIVYILKCTFMNWFSATNLMTLVQTTDVISA